MTYKFYVLLIFLTPYIFLFGCKEAHKSGNDTSSKMLVEMPTKTKDYGELLQKKERRDFLPDIPQIGSTALLGEDQTCSDYGDILAYARTAKYLIYVCGDEGINQPKSMVLFTRDKNPQKTVIDQNPSITWWNRSYAFKQEPYYQLDRPNSTIYLNQPRIFFFRITKDFNSSTELNKEPIQLYLFNEMVVPNYRKTVLPFDDRAKDRFLKFFPVLNKQFVICSEPFSTNKSYSGYSFSSKPDRVIAYEIEPQKYLIELACDVYTRSDTNDLIQYILYSEDSLEPKAKIIPFHTLISPETDKTMGETLSLRARGGANFFPEDNTVRLYNIESGAGGYGTAQEHKLIEDRFELQEYRRYPSTATARRRTPEEFPKIYPSTD
ncbi:hypothetical protein [Pseudanabaena sp. UWO310]|uniref:hypothetical protein n=1 Tax=Pseudanabaena sp. UWO310 TaxID=2480795 RepID=UPI0011571033|nr:hypothetical protein [Pseudanabaena sp. UWO310]TYQ31288.1 hypothetical protein PseudUWO310_04560 [Pseudanabaena sp. UWO310]